MEVDYPKDKVEILVGSDGSQDTTAEIVQKYTNHGIHFYAFDINRGKTLVQNDLVEHSKGEILVFTDAASFIRPDALKKLVGNFADERVGCVAGKMRFINTDSNLTTQSQGLYWKYQSKLREWESKLGALIGVDGPLYAVRRQYYVPLGNNLISDLLTPLLVLEQGKKVILESEAVVDEDPTLKAEHEFNTRRRITLRGLVGLFHCIRLLNPVKHPLLGSQIFFHKLVRWFVGPLMIINFLACAALLSHGLFNIIFIFYLMFIFSALVGWLASYFGKTIKLFAIPYYFILINFAATMGVVDFIRRKQAVTWKPVRE